MRITHDELTADEQMIAAKRQAEVAEWRASITNDGGTLSPAASAPPVYFRLPDGTAGMAYCEEDIYENTASRLTYPPRDGAFPGLNENAADRLAAELFPRTK